MFRLRVKEILHEQRISQNALSIGAGIAINMVRKLVHNPHYDHASSTLFKVARFLQVNMSEPCYDDNAAEPASE